MSQPTAPSLTPADLRAEAAQHEQDARDSFDRCDTDGFLTQWASGLSAAKARRQATIVENGGTATFPAVFTVDGEWTPAQIIHTQYGARWMLLDSNGNRTGEYLPFHPVRRTTLAKRGYVEGYVTRPARADFADGGSLTSVHVVDVPLTRPWEAPESIVTADRWVEED